MDLFVIHEGGERGVTRENLLRRLARSADAALPFSAAQRQRRVQGRENARRAANRRRAPGQQRGGPRAGAANGRPQGVHSARRASSRAPVRAYGGCEKIRLRAAGQGALAAARPPCGDAWLGVGLPCCASRARDRLALARRVPERPPLNYHRRPLPPPHTERATSCWPFRRIHPSYFAAAAV